MWFRTCSNITCSRLSVSEDDRESEWATSGISCEWDPGVKRRGRPLFLYQTPLFASSHFQSVTPTERLEQASCNRKAPAKRSQHIATLLGATCCVRLATVLRCVATYWVLLAQVWKCSNLTQQHPTPGNMSQHGGQTHATCCAQQCCDMLHWHVAIVWPELKAY